MSMIYFLAGYLLFLAFYKFIMTVRHPNVKNINHVEALNLLTDDSEVLIIDVRTEKQYNKNKFKNGMNILESELEVRISEIIKFKDKPVLVCCEKGNKSPFAVRTLLKAGFTNIYNLKKGVSSWRTDLDK